MTTQKETASKLTFPFSMLRTTGPLGLAKTYNAYRTLRKQHWLIERYYAAPLMQAIAKEIPGELYFFWKPIARKTFPLLRIGSHLYIRSVIGLLSYFKCVQLVGDKQTVVPSKAVDCVWQAWVAWNEASLNAFCSNHFGRTISRDLTMENFNEDALVRTWVANCFLNGIKCSSGKIPDLFSLDRRLRLPSGWRFERLSTPKFGIYHCAIKEHVHPVESDWCEHPGLTEEELHRRGYISEIRATDGKVFDEEEPSDEPNDSCNYAPAVFAIATSEAITSRWLGWNDGCSGTPSGFYYSGWDPSDPGFGGGNSNGFGGDSSWGGSSSSWGGSSSFGGSDSWGGGSSSFGGSDSWGGGSSSFGGGSDSFGGGGGGGGGSSSDW